MRLKPAGFLDLSILQSFRQTINSSPIFRKQDGLKEKYDLICAFMDRIESAARYLNDHSDFPKSEEEFISFMVFASMVRDGINKLFENIYFKKPPYWSDKKFFVIAVNFGESVFTDETCPSDESFFEYLRALSFAHPFAVDNRRGQRAFIQDGEIQCSPWAIVANPFYQFKGFVDGVGARIYSNKQSKIIDLTIPFSTLKEYLKDRFEYIKQLEEWAKNDIQKQEEKWKEIKIDRQQEPVAVLKEIVIVLSDRFQETDDIETLIEYLSCKLSEPKNEKNVLLFQNAIIETIPAICDCVENLDYSKLDEVISFAFDAPTETHEKCGYQLEKIFSYLDRQRSKTIGKFSDERWGLIQAKEFSKGFAKKWVLIDVRHMDYSEIRLLVQTACYLETEEQKRG